MNERQEHLKPMRRIPYHGEGRAAKEATQSKKLEGVAKDLLNNQPIDYSFRKLTTLTTLTELELSIPNFIMDNSENTKEEAYTAAYMDFYKSRESHMNTLVSKLSSSLCTGSTSTDEGNPGVAAPPKKHFPPITIENVANQVALLKHLQNITNLKLEAKLIGTKLRIYPQMDYAYHCIRKYTDENSLEEYTYMLPEDKKLRLVVAHGHTSR
ncbi:hypothetical protein TNCV_1670631 [Trichonephila clavipes]|nr:hypothetical protein TNCV_1670631 [Trichonephila clavipes]